MRMVLIENQIAGASFGRERNLRAMRQRQLRARFLSNRVYPSASNTKLLDMGIRTKIHDLIYEAIKN